MQPTDIGLRLRIPTYSSEEGDLKVLDDPAVAQGGRERDEGYHKAPSSLDS